MKKEIPEVSVFQFYSNAQRILQNPLPFHKRNFEKLGDTFQVHLGLGKRLIFSRNAGLAHYVLQKNQRNYRKSSIQTKEMARYLGRGLLTAEGTLWKKQRRLIQPAFHKEHLSLLLDKMHSAIGQEIGKIETGKNFPVSPFFGVLTFQIVVKALFSQAVSETEILELRSTTETSQEMLVKKLRQPYLRWWFHVSGQMGRSFKRSRHARKLLENLIDQRRAKGNQHNDLLDRLMQAQYEDGSHMEKEQLIDEILILFTAGHETSSNALSFTCALLARYPSLQEQIFKEIIKAEERSDDLLDFIQNCSLLKQSIEESMRLYPPAYFIDRENLEADEFEGMSFPKASSILLSIYEIHRHPTYWKHPEQFEPERFSGQPPREYFPFGAGPRKCIGSNFAMYEMILTLAEVIKRFRIGTRDPKIELRPMITLKPVSVDLCFTNRDGTA